MSELEEADSRPEMMPQPGGNGWQTTWLALAALGMLLIGVANLVNSTERSQAAKSRSSQSPTPMVPAESHGKLRVAGKTEPAPGYSASITPIMIHPVVKLLAKPGDRVKAGQVILELDRDEPEAEVRAHKAEVAQLQASLARLKAVPREQERDKARAELEAARVTAKGAREHLHRITALLAKEAIAPGQELAARTESLNADADERAAAAYLEFLLKQPIPQEIAALEAQIANAQAELDSVTAELEHYTLFAPIDGILAWLTPTLGSAVRPGTAVWGEIIDLRQLDVRVYVTSEQADRIDQDQPASVVLADGSRLSGQVAFISPEATKETGLLPVLVRVSNPQERLRASVDVNVELPLKSAK